MISYGGIAFGCYTPPYEIITHFPQAYCTANGLPGQRTVCSLVDGHPYHTSCFLPVVLLPLLCPARAPRRRTPRCGGWENESGRGPGAGHTRWSPKKRVRTRAASFPPLIWGKAAPPAPGPGAPPPPPPPPSALPRARLRGRDRAERGAPRDHQARRLLR
eukprot:gene21737-biopygen2676